MTYKLFVTDRAEELLAAIIAYHVCKLKNKEAARELLGEIDRRYTQIIDHPQMFQLSEDNFLKRRGYHRVAVRNYLLLYLVNEKKKEVYIMGIFHNLEDYRSKL